MRKATISKFVKTFAAAALIAMPILGGTTGTAEAQTRRMPIDCLGAWLSMQMYEIQWYQTGDTYYRDAASGQRNPYNRWCTR